VREDLGKRIALFIYPIRKSRYEICCDRAQPHQKRHLYGREASRGNNEVLRGCATRIRRSDHHRPRRRLGHQGESIRTQHRRGKGQESFLRNVHSNVVAQDPVVAESLDTGLGGQLSVYDCPDDKTK
jgi:hypothetical protein